MNQTPSQSHQVAWFKLSEFIKRREKERALAIYRLLMHTIDQPAFAKQVEGDLLMAFNDPGAVTSYLEAAQLYRKELKMSQATAIYEHLVIQYPENQLFLSSLIEHYLELNYPTRIVMTLGHIIEHLIQVHQESAALDAIKQVIIILKPTDQLALYTTTLTHLLNICPEQETVIKNIIKKIVILTSDNIDERERFIKELTIINPAYGEYVHTCNSNKKSS